MNCLSWLRGIWTEGQVDNKSAEEIDIPNWKTMGHSCRLWCWLWTEQALGDQMQPLSRSSAVIAPWPRHQHHRHHRSPWLIFQSLVFWLFQKSFSLRDELNGLCNTRLHSWILPCLTAYDTSTTYSTIITQYGITVYKILKIFKKTC